MRRILTAVGLLSLLVLVAAWVCRDRRTDVVPTRIEPLPVEPPQPVVHVSPD
jgi:hypothetical protein